MGFNSGLKGLKKKGS